MEWQPIETAPTDGTVFLGYRLGQVGEAYTRVSGEGREIWSFCGTSGAIKFYPYLKPTHWMPLPKPPTNV